jgi:hypothetical protein
MIRIRFVLPALLLSAGTLLAQTAPPAPAPQAKMIAVPAAMNRAILLVNAAGIPDDQMEVIRAFAQKDLWVKVEAVNLKADYAALPGQIPGLFTSNRLVVVALGKGSPENAQILSAPDNGWALVNAGPILALKDKQEHMLKQQTMRGIGYALGVATCFDPFCAMRAGESLADLSKAGSNYCPITRKEYQNQAVRSGFMPRNPTRLPFKKAGDKKPEEKKAEPAAPAAPAKP